MNKKLSKIFVHKDISTTLIKKPFANTLFKFLN